MSNVRRPNQSIFSNVSKRLNEFSNMLDTFSAPIKKHHASKTYFVTSNIPQNELNDLSKKAKALTEKLILLEGQILQLAKNFGNLDLQSKNKCVSGLEAALNPFNLAKNGFLTSFNGSPVNTISNSLLDEVKLELDQHLKNLSKLSNDDQEILKMRIKNESVLREGAKVANETLLLFVTTGLCLRSPEFTEFNNHLTTVDSSIKKLKSSIVSVTTNSFIKSEPVKPAGGQVIVNKAPAKIIK